MFAFTHYQIAKSPLVKLPKSFTENTASVLGEHNFTIKLNALKCFHNLLFCMFVVYLFLKFN